MLNHFANCRADYPEKDPREPAQATIDIGLADGTAARTCVDCGAFEIVTVDNTPRPGLMPLCSKCIWRRGTSCGNPLAAHNNPDGRIGITMNVKIKKKVGMFYPAPAHYCRGRMELVDPLHARGK